MTSALRKKLLSLAIRGKLVPQDPADEPASVLLERIRAERESKENESPRRGRSRRSSSDNPPCPKRGTSAAVPTGVEDAAFEPPFPIPESWTWTKLEEVCEILDYMRRPVTRKHRTKGEYPYYGATGIQDYVAEWIFDETLVLLGEDGAKWAAGDNSAFLITGKTWVNNHAHVLRPNASLLHEWLILVLNGLDLLPFVTCTTVPKLNQEKTRTIPIPLPPISEQRNIVSRFEGLSSFCDSIDEDSIALDTLARTAKSRILDLAIRGALVFQNPTDEPASKLLNRIRSTADKPPCPKKGGKAEPIGISDPLFPIPESWEWTTLGEIGEVVRGTGIKRSDMSETGRPCVRYGEIYTTYSLRTEKVVSFISEELYRSSKHVQARSVLMTLTGEDRKDIAKTIAYLGDEPIAISGDMLGICPREVEPLYLSFVLNSPWAIERKGKLATGDLVIHISQKSMSCFPVPLPPLAEQRRIVAKVEKLFSAIDAMTTK